MSDPAFATGNKGQFGVPQPPRLVRSDTVAAIEPDVNTTPHQIIWQLSSRLKQAVRFAEVSQLVPSQLVPSQLEPSWCLTQFGGWKRSLPPQMIRHSGRLAPQIWSPRFVFLAGSPLRSDLPERDAHANSPSGQNRRGCAQDVARCLRAVGIDGRLLCAFRYCRRVERVGRGGVRFATSGEGRGRFATSSE